MKRIIGAVLAAAITLLAVPVAAAPTEAPSKQAVTSSTIARGSRGENVRTLQARLSAYGYSVAVDGVFGPQTEAAVRHWQRANGLLVDGIVGPITSASLQQAVRVSPPAPPVPIIDSSPSSSDIPEFLNDCDEMNYFRKLVGLPEQFSDQPRTGPKSSWGWGWRESNCKNDAPPSIPEAACCRGYWAIHKSNITAPGYRAGAAACGIKTEWDYYGDSYEQKLASACFAKVLWDWYVTHPGSANPWRL